VEKQTEAPGGIKELPGDGRRMAVGMKRHLFELVEGAGLEHCGCG
jgi:hypothetical protein